MPYGFSDQAWRAMEQEEKDAIKAQWEKNHPPHVDPPPAPPRPVDTSHLPQDDVIDAGLFPPPPKPGPRQKPGGPPPGPSAAQPPPAAPQTGAAGENWYVVRKLNEYPGNFPPIDWLRSAGITGISFESDDPLLEQGIAEAQQLGFKTAVWANPVNYSDDETCVRDLAAIAAKYGLSAVFLDTETQFKGPPGSPEWDRSQKIAELARLLIHVDWSTTPIRSDKNDFDFKSYIANGGTVVVQTYGENPLRDLFDPVEVVNLVISAGVPVTKISVAISPLQVSTAPPALHAIGINSISVWGESSVVIGGPLPPPFRQQPLPPHPPPPIHTFPPSPHRKARHHRRKRRLLQRLRQLLRIQRPS